MTRIFIFLMTLLAWQLSAEPPVSAVTPVAGETPAHGPKTSKDRYVPIANSNYYGVSFQCSREKLNVIRPQLAQLMKDLDWKKGQVIIRDDGNRLMLQLNTKENDHSTLDLKERKELGIQDDKYNYTDHSGKPITREIVSKKEILAALMQRGRVTEFSEELCNIDSLIDHVALRQNVVKWTNRIMWLFPEGLDEKLNPKLWTENRATPPGVRSQDALSDLFSGKFPYQIDCFTACKAFESHGTVNHFHADSHLAEAMEILLDGDPLRKMATDLDDNGKILNSGKLLDQHIKVAPRNWIPGDWGYIKNTDSISRELYGDEGSNLVYIGGGKFPRFYAEHPHDRDFEKALKYVYSWRLPGKQKYDTTAVQDSLIPQLEKTPLEGGLVWDYRDFPSLSLRNRLEVIAQKEAKAKALRLAAETND